MKRARREREAQSRSERTRLKRATAKHIMALWQKEVITEAQRYEAGDLVVHELTRYGDPWKLKEDVSDNQPGPRWENGKPP